ncbi:hypothetical protein J6590_035729 [Homalodisca vitripennis]|nr:hypothetical protein J6590_035729 [Homalodisca vitripennis]
MSTDQVPNGVQLEGSARLNNQANYLCGQVGQRGVGFASGSKSGASGYYPINPIVPYQQGTYFLLITGFTQLATQPSSQQGSDDPVTSPRVMDASTITSCSNVSVTCCLTPSSTSSKRFDLCGVRHKPHVSHLHSSSRESRQSPAWVWRGGRDTACHNHNGILVREYSVAVQYRRVQLYVPEALIGVKALHSTVVPTLQSHYILEWPDHCLAHWAVTLDTVAQSGLKQLFDKPRLRLCGFYESEQEIALNVSSLQEIALNVSGLQEIEKCKAVPGIGAN